MSSSSSTLVPPEFVPHLTIHLNKEDTSRALLNMFSNHMHYSWPEAQCVEHPAVTKSEAWLAGKECFDIIGRRMEEHFAPMRSDQRGQASSSIRNALRSGFASLFRSGPSSGKVSSSQLKKDAQVAHEILREITEDRRLVVSEVSAESFDTQLKEAPAYHFSSGVWYTTEAADQPNRRLVSCVPIVYDMSTGNLGIQVHEAMHLSTLNPATEQHGYARDAWRRATDASSGMDGLPVLVGPDSKNSDIVRQVEDAIAQRYPESKGEQRSGSELSDIRALQSGTMDYENFRTSRSNPFDDQYECPD